MSFATCCVRLELRSLPSAGVTRFPRYYEPLRHPRAPGLSLTGVRLVLSFLTCPRFGASRVARAFLVYVLPPLPRCSDWASSSLISPSRISLPRNCSRVGKETADELRLVFDDMEGAVFDPVAERLRLNNSGPRATSHS